MGPIQGLVIHFFNLPFTGAAWYENLIRSLQESSRRREHIRDAGVRVRGVESDELREQTSLPQSGNGPNRCGIPNFALCWQQTEFLTQLHLLRLTLC